YGMTNAGFVNQTKNLVRFQSDDPTGSFLIIGPLTGALGGQTLVSMDFRPATGQLYALSAFATSPRTAQLYTVNLSTAALTPVGSGFLLGAPDNAGIEMEFDPVA